MSRKFQSAICWCLFGVLMCAVTALGGALPVFWSLMSIAVLLCFVAQLVVEVLTPRPAALNRLWLPAFLFLGVLVWGTVQRLPGLPADWAHPVWAAAEVALSAAPQAQAEAGTLGPVISADPGRGAHILMRLSAYAMVFWIAVRCAGDRHRAWTMLRVFAMASTMFAAYGILTWGIGLNPILGGTSNSLSSTFVNRNNYATFAVFGVLANMAAFFRASRTAEGTRRNPLAGFLEGLVAGAWVWVLGVILCAGALLLTQSRAGALAGLIGTLVFVVAYFRRGQRASLAPVVIVGFLLVITFLGSAAGLVDRLFLMPDEDTRHAVFPRIVEAIGDRPLLGHGLGAFEDVFRAYVPQMSSFAEWDMAHNSYLENAFEMGLPAAAAFYLALTLLGLHILQGLAVRNRDRTILSFALGAFMAAAFHSVLDFSLQMPGLAAVFAWILGLGYAQSFPESEMIRHRSRRRSDRSP